MKKYKVNINREKVSSEEIASRRDFDSVLKSFNSSPSAVSKPFYKTGWFAAGSAVVVIATVAAAWWFGSAHSSTKGTSGNNTIVKNDSYENTTRQPGRKALTVAFIDRPFKNVDVAYETFSVDAGKGGEFDHAAGSSIKVPAGAFADGNGNDVKGEVELRYREFHDPIDFFISGIPMSYDSAGKTYQFESAGMMEMLAFQDGKQLQMKKGKEIEVKMRSAYDGDYNLYALDTAARNWVYKGKDKVIKEKKTGTDTQDTQGHATDNAIGNVPTASSQKAEKVSKEIAEIKKEIVKIEHEKPQEPQKATTGRYKFNIEVDPKEFPEIALYQGVVFEVGEENKSFTKEMYKVVWDDATLAEGTKKGLNYKMTLVKGDEKSTFIVYPVLTGKNYDAAIAEYKQKFKTYQATLEKRKADEQKKVQEYKALVKKIEEERKAEQVKWTAQQQALQQQWQQQAAVFNTTEQVYRVFRVNHFGVYNCDSPKAYPVGNTVAAVFTDGAGQPLALQNVQLVDDKRNGIFIYGNYSFDRLSYDPASGNMLWAVTPDNRLAIARSDAFAGIPKNGQHTFKMIVADKELKTAEEVRSYIMSNGAK